MARYSPIRSCCFTGKRPMRSITSDVVILGGGAGGLELAVRLAKAGHHEVLLIDEDETHVWKPRLHELAAGMRRGHVSELEYTGLAQYWGFAFERGTLQDIDPSAARLTLTPIESPDGYTVVPGRQIAYRALVLALGGVTPDMGVEGVLEHAILLDRETDAEALSRRYSDKLLARAHDSDGQPMQVVIVGSGLTGVELAAHLASDAVCTALAPRAALPTVTVSIVEATDTFMSGMQEDVRETVRKRLDRLGVEVTTGQQVGKVTANAVETQDGNRFPADITIWATGRVGPPVAGDVDVLATNKKRQWRVRQTLQSIDNEAVFALGDCAYIDDDPAPPTAQAASEQAEHLAAQLPRYLNGAQPKNFAFEDKGTLLSLGKGGSVGKVRNFFGDDVQVRGRLARSAYRGLQRQREFLLLGSAKGTARVLSDVFGHSMSPRLKIH